MRIDFFFQQHYQLFKYKLLNAHVFKLRCVELRIMLDKLSIFNIESEKQL